MSGGVEIYVFKYSIQMSALWSGVMSSDSWGLIDFEHVITDKRLTLGCPGVKLK